MLKYDRSKLYTVTVVIEELQKIADYVPLLSYCRCGPLINTHGAFSIEPGRGCVPDPSIIDFSLSITNTTR